MIRFLNAGSVAGYAQIGVALPGDWQSVSVTEESVSFQRAEQPVFLCPQQGMAVLQLVQTRGRVYSYYLDKAVTVNPGVSFCVLPLDAPCVIGMYASCIPERVSDRAVGVPEKPSAEYIDRIYTLFDQRHGPGFLFSGERHRPYELVCVLEGCLHTVVGGKEYTVTAHQAILLPPDVWHTQYGETTQGVHFVTAAFRCAAPLPAASLLHPFTLSRVAEALLGEMAQDLTDESLQEKRLLSGIRYLLTPWLVHCERQSADSRETDALPHENAILDRSLEYIATHIEEKLTLADVARHSGVSIAYLSQLFRRCLHTSPGAYLQHVRLEQAGRMLRRGAGTVFQVAEALHFSSPQHFCTAFKKHYGVSPLQYAKGKRL